MLRLKMNSRIRPRLIYRCSLLCCCRLIRSIDSLRVFSDGANGLRRDVDHVVAWLEQHHWLELDDEGRQRLASLVVPSRRTDAHLSLRSHLCAGDRWKLTGHCDTGARPSHENRHQPVPTKPRRQRPATGCLLYAVHAHPNTAPELHLRQCDVHTHPLHARCDQRHNY